MRWRNDRESVGKCFSKSRYVKGKYHCSPFKQYNILDKLLVMLLCSLFKVGQTHNFLFHMQTTIL